MARDDGKSAVDGKGALLARLRLAPVSRRPELLTQFLREHIARQLTLEPSDVDSRAPLMALGMSSLQAMEVKMYLEKELAVLLPASLVFDYPTVASLAARILDQSGLSPASASRPLAPTHLGVHADADGQPDVDVAQSLARELADLKRQGDL